MIIKVVSQVHKIKSELVLYCSRKRNALCINFYSNIFFFYRYTIALVKCTCLAKRPILYSDIAVLYSFVGMLFLPTYFKRKAAQSANDINLPVQVISILITVK